MYKSMIESHYDLMYMKLEKCASKHYLCTSGLTYDIW